jgi:hypothetical protein
MNWMRSAIHVLLIIVLAGALAISGDMPCSKQGDPPQQCPVPICQATATCLADDQTNNIPFLQERSTEVIDLTTLPISLGSVGADQRNAGSPPGVTGRLFIRTHSLLI